jgi:benzodiazapine receptor
MNKDLLRQFVNVVTFILTVVVNVLANALPLNGMNSGEISDRFAIYFVPAGYVFSIWSIIYLTLLVFTIYQALPSQRENPRLRNIGYWFALSGLANCAWLFLWHYEIFLFTWIVMLILLVSLIMIYLRLDIGRSKVSLTEQLLVNLPFSIYLGWITVATIANITQVLFYINWNGWGIAPQVWAVIMLVVAVIVGLIMAWARADIAYLLVLAWAFAGIAVKQASVGLVANAAWISTVFVLVAVVLAFIRRRTLLVSSQP